MRDHTRFRLGPRHDPVRAFSVKVELAPDALVLETYISQFGGCELRASLPKANLTEDAKSRNLLYAKQ